MFGWCGISSVYETICVERNEVGAVCEDEQVPMDTVVFVDCDGIINVSFIVKDALGAMVFDAQNFERSSKMAETHAIDDARTIEHMDPVASTMLSISSHSCGEDEQYNELLASSSSCFNDALVGRLARLIQLAGKRRTVVLSSTWRKPRCAGLVNALEVALSEHLAESFTFDRQTPQCDGVESNEKRLELISNFVSKMCEESEATKQLRVLVLDDFGCSAMGRWSCGGQRMDSVAAVEEYLERMGSGRVTAKLVHPHDEWELPDGSRVRVGSGLTSMFFSQAANFLCQPVSTDRFSVLVEV